MSLASAVAARADDWNTLALQVTVKPESPNHGKAVTLARFENEKWLAIVMVWETGELQLELARTTDGWRVAKHYDITEAAQLDGVLTDLISAIRTGDAPFDAVVWWHEQR